MNTRYDYIKPNVYRLPMRRVYHFICLLSATLCVCSCYCLLLRVCVCISLLIVDIRIDATDVMDGGWRVQQVPWQRRLLQRHQWLFVGTRTHVFNHLSIPCTQCTPKLSLMNGRKGEMLKHKGTRQHATRGGHTSFPLFFVCIPICCIDDEWCLHTISN